VLIAQVGWKRKVDLPCDDEYFTSIFLLMYMYVMCSMAAGDIDFQAANRPLI